jgi:hypothetical protein
MHALGHLLPQRARLQPGGLFERLDLSAALAGRRRLLDHWWYLRRPPVRARVLLRQRVLSARLLQQRTVPLCADLRHDRQPGRVRDVLVVDRHGQLRSNARLLGQRSLLQRQYLRVAAARHTRHAGRDLLPPHECDLRRQLAVLLRADLQRQRGVHRGMRFQRRAMHHG